MDGVKYDGGKLRFDLVPQEPYEDVVKVLMFGAGKYEPDNWQRVPMAKLRYIAAAFRHLWARLCGEVIDKESGLPHTAHAICCLLFFGWFDYRPRQKNKRIYISGPISGIPNYNREAFEQAESRLSYLGYVPVSPFRLGVTSRHKSWQDYMREDIKALMDVDCVLALPGYEQSKGATEEIRIARTIGIPIYAMDGNKLSILT